MIPRGSEDGDFGTSRARPWAAAAAWAVPRAVVPIRLEPLDRFVPRGPLPEVEVEFAINEQVEAVVARRFHGRHCEGRTSHALSKHCPMPASNIGRTSASPSN